MADNSILSRLDGLKLKYEETGQKLTDPEVIADVKQFVQLNKEYKELEPIIETSERYRTALANLAEAKDILSNDKDEEMREMARGEITELEPAIEQMEEQIKLLLIPKDPQDSKNAIMEIRGGTGGDEAAIFAGDLLRMYTKYIESKGWRYEVTSFSDGRRGRLQGSRPQSHGAERLRHAQIRVGRAPCPARAPDRDAGPRPYVGRIGGRTARSRGIRRRDLDERHPQGHLLRLGARRGSRSTRPIRPSV